MRIYQFDPTRDARWTPFVEQHPRASVFHTTAWLRALQRTYGYEPVAFTTSPPNAELRNGVVFCRVKSWLTGRRLISLPFSDHCEPLCDSSEDLSFVMRYLLTTLERQGWKYLEVRGVDWDLAHVTDTCMSMAPAYLLHCIDLRPAPDRILSSFDKDSVQRRIRRAEGAGLVERIGRSDELLRDFYGLFVTTRRRHHLPPIPYAWFQNLIQCLAEGLEIRAAYMNKVPVAAILTLSFRHEAYYKYGCADSQYFRFGATPWLLWRAISAAKSRGCTTFDMGRTEEGHTGLLAFKNRWVSESKRIVYWTFPARSSFTSPRSWQTRFGKHLFARMPNRLLTITGRLIYRHIA
jgi:hypothetical protein